MTKYKDFFNTLGLEDNSSLEDVNNAYITAKEAWRVDEFAADELKIKSKEQLKLIDEAYKTLVSFLKSNNSDIKDTSYKTNQNSSSKQSINNNIDDIEKNYSSQENKNFSNDEYLKFNITTENIEISQFKIHYWWRILYLLIIFSALFIMHYLYPLKEPVLQNNTQKQEVKVNNKSFKQEISTDNNKQNQTQSNDLNLKKTKKNNQISSSTEKTVIKTETKQSQNQIVTQKTSTSKSDFDKVSDYFE